MESSLRLGRRCGGCQTKNDGMSDEQAKTVDPRPFNWGTPEKITAFFCLNLLAAYAPAVAAMIWIAGVLSWRDSPAIVLTLFLFSPVGLAGLLMSSVIDPTSAAAAWFCLAAFIPLLFWASTALHNSRKAWIAIPSVIFVYSLLQGMLFAGAIGALHAMP
jgi:hypothetical protein